jgi:MYXO-CTERM domain-containing protein
MKFKNTLIAATLLLSITSAQAALVHTDWKTAGDQQATLSEETGLEWLKMQNTANMSINQIKSQLDTTYAGWRLPTNEEVGDLVTAHFSTMTLSASRTSSGEETSVAQGNSWLTFMSATYTSASVGTSYGLHTDGSNSGSLTGGYTYTDPISTHVYNDDRNPGYTLDYAHVYYGVYLVSDGGTTLSSQLDPSINANNANAPVSDVSAPALLGLMGLGLFGFAARRRSSTTLNK